MHGERLLAVDGAKAVGAGVAAADDDDALAGCENLERRIERVAMAALVLLRQEFHGEMDSLQLTAGNFEIARMLGAARQNDGVKVAAQIFDRNVRADFGVGDELHAFGGHLFEAAVDDVLFQLELGDAVAQQSADAVCFFVDRDRVSGAAKLLSRGQTCRAGTDDGDFLSRAKLRRLGTDPAFRNPRSTMFFSFCLIVTGGCIDAEHARSFAGSGADASRELGEIVGRVQLADGVFPASAIDEIVPVGNEVVDRASGLAERNAAIHAAGALLAKLFFGKILIDLEPVVHALERPGGAERVRAE